MHVDVRFDATRPATHLVRVTQVFPASDQPQRTFRMAAWIPGSYKIYDLGRHVQDFTAQVDGKAATWRQDGKDAWRVEGTRGLPVHIVFDVYCRDLTVDTSHVTGDHAHLFPITLVLYDQESRKLPHRVKVAAPKGWALWSGLETDALAGTLDVAEDYDHLIDCPIELGPAEAYHVETFTVRARKHRLVVWKPPTHMDWARVRRDVRAIVDETCRVFGGAPYPHYTFLTHLALGHGGGLEHRNSTVLGADPLHLQDPEQLQTKFYPLVAHEFFHTWNVKRILPEAFTPYALQTETYTDLLWLFEGFTTYYELPVLARAKAVDAKAWGKVAAEMLQYYELALGRKRRPVGEASRLTWTLLYQPHEQNINRNVSYYTKGLWVGLCLDAALRKQGVPGGLDVVMRHLWQEYGKTGIGVPEDGFAGIVKEATGKDLARQIKKWTDGTSELPIEASLRILGWQVERDWKDKDHRMELGVMFQSKASIIERIPEDSPAALVLQPDDEVVAVDGCKWSAERFVAAASTRKAGETIGLTVFREGMLRTFDVPLREKEKDKIEIKPKKGDAAATKRRKAWLGAGF